MKSTTCVASILLFLNFKTIFATNLYKAIKIEYPVNCDKLEIPSENTKFKVQAKIILSEKDEMVRNFCIQWAFKSSFSENDVFDFDVPPTPYFDKHFTQCGIDNGDELELELDYTNLQLDEKTQFGIGVGYYELSVQAYYDLSKINSNNKGNRRSNKSSVIVVTDLDHLYFAFSDPVYFQIQKDKPPPSSYSTFELSSFIKNLKHKEEGLKETKKQLKEKLKSESIWDCAPKLKRLYDWHLDSRLLQALDELEHNFSYDHLVGLLKREYEGVYSLPILSSAFRELLMNETNVALKNLPKGETPNTMNNYGITLLRLGMSEWIDDFRERVIIPLSVVAFPNWGAFSINRQHVFTISYRLGEDEHLDRHLDGSEVTLNVCLGTQFTGALVSFEEQRGKENNAKEIYKDKPKTIVHSPGIGIFHVGQHWHSATKLISGERHNMVFWGTSQKQRSSVRELNYLTCDKQENYDGRTTSNNHVEL